MHIATAELRRLRNARATQSWRGKVTRLMPPNYGIVDSVAFYVNAAVVGDSKLAVQSYDDCNPFMS